MVHGSPSDPEAFLSASDTKLVRSMLDAMHILHNDSSSDNHLTMNSLSQYAQAISQISYATTSNVLKEYGSSWMQSAINSWMYSVVGPTFSHINNDYAQAGNSIGDISISITEASFADDADYEEVARRVGAEFTKELSRQGFRISAFNF